MPVEPSASPDRAQEAVRRIAELLARADALLITAGAGMSVDSGLPDFRSPQGLWRAYPPLAKLGLSFEQMAQPRWFASSPEMAWAWYGHRQQLYRQATPHGGYRILRGWAQATFEIDLARLRAKGELPRCPHCGAIARPNVLMFNDWGWVDTVAREQQRRFDEWLAGLQARRVVVLE